MLKARDPSSGWDKPKQSALRQAAWTGSLQANGAERDPSSSQRTVRQPHTIWVEVPGKPAVGTPEGEAPCGGQREALKPIINSPRAQAPAQASPSHRGFRSPESRWHPKSQNMPREPATALPASAHASVVSTDLSRRSGHDAASRQESIKGHDAQQAKKAIGPTMGEVLSAAGPVSKHTGTHADLLHGFLAQQGEIVLELQACRERNQQMAERLRMAEEQNSWLREDVSSAATMAEAAKQELVDGLITLKRRESELVKEVERRREEAREARAEAVRAQDINRSMLAARRGAREAISDIAQMNARLCALYLDAKHDLKQAASKHEDEHRQWQGVIGELEDSLRAANQQRVACCQLMGGTPPAARHQALAGSLDPCMPCPASHSPDPYCTPPQVSDWEQAQHVEDMEAANRKLQEENEELRKEKQETDARADRLASLQRAEGHKQAGNVAFQQQQFTKAAEQYTEGLSEEVEDQNLRAVLHTNRAAAALALGRPLDAIADCCMAAVHDPGYLRLYQRRAEAYTAIMDYASASQDLMHLVQHGWQEMRAKLHEAQGNAAVRPAPPVDAYKVLGVSTSATSQQIRTAFKQLALKWHPDKAAGAPPTKAAADVVFKLLSAANAILSDPGKRRQHDFVAARWKNQHAQQWRHSHNPPFIPGGMGPYCYH